MQVTQIQLINTPEILYTKPTDKYKFNDRVIISLSDGEEIGVVKSTTEIKESVDLVSISRLATDSDHKKNCENCKFTRQILPEIKEEANKLNLDMKIGFISTNLEQNKIIVCYTSASRVDFRELIKILGSKYKTRIEMRQIGNRDETKQVGAIGICGRVCCCKAFLDDFDKVSIKMAKNQNITLNPNKINGMCGRLLCCLKYEDEYYEEMQKKMPKENSYVTTPDGKGVVTSRDFLTETVMVTFTKDDKTEIKKYALSDLITDNTSKK